MNVLNNENGNGGIGIFGLLGICFVVLKLTGFINWSWLWVLSPFWGSFLLIIGLIVAIAAARS